MPELLTPLADHPVLDAVPFFLPALVIGLALVVLAIRNRGRDQDAG